MASGTPATRTGSAANHTPLPTSDWEVIDGSVDTEAHEARLQDEVKWAAVKLACYSAIAGVAGVGIMLCAVLSSGREVASVPGGIGVWISVAVTIFKGILGGIMYKVVSNNLGRAMGAKGVPFEVMNKTLRGPDIKGVRQLMATRGVAHVAYLTAIVVGLTAVLGPVAQRMVKPVQVLEVKSAASLWPGYSVNQAERVVTYAAGTKRHDKQLADGMSLLLSGANQPAQQLRVGANGSSTAGYQVVIPAWFPLCYPLGVSITGSYDTGNFNAYTVPSVGSGTFEASSSQVPLLYVGVALNITNYDPNPPNRARTGANAYDVAVRNFYYVRDMGFLTSSGGQAPARRVEGGVCTMRLSAGTATVAADGSFSMEEVGSLDLVPIIQEFYQDSGKEDTLSSSIGLLKNAALLSGNTDYSRIFGVGLNATQGKVLENMAGLAHAINANTLASVSLADNDGQLHETAYEVTVLRYANDVVVMAIVAAMLVVLLLSGIVTMWPSRAAYRAKLWNPAHIALCGVSEELKRMNLCAVGPEVAKKIGHLNIFTGHETGGMNQHRCYSLKHSLPGKGMKLGHHLVSVTGPGIKFCANYGNRIRRLCNIGAVLINARLDMGRLILDVTNNRPMYVVTGLKHPGQARELLSALIGCPVVPSNNTLKRSWPSADSSRADKMHHLMKEAEPVKHEVCSSSTHAVCQQEFVTAGRLKLVKKVMLTSLAAGRSKTKHIVQPMTSSDEGCSELEEVASECSSGLVHAHGRIAATVEAETGRRGVLKAHQEDRDAGSLALHGGPWAVMQNKRGRWPEPDG